MPIGVFDAGLLQAAVESRSRIWANCEDENQAAPELRSARIPGVRMAKRVC
jgi:hypothetical protein